MSILAILAIGIALAFAHFFGHAVQEPKQRLMHNLGAAQVVGLARLA